MRRVVIVGTGLIGASVGLALRARGFDGEIVGTGPTEKTLRIAQGMGAIDEWVARDGAEAVAAGADVILLAGPVMSILDWMQRLAPVLCEGQLVTDVGSTKVQIAELAARLGYNKAGKARFLPGHPMAGKESGGAALAEAGLFENAMWLFTPLAGAGVSEREAEWRAWVAKFGARTMDLDAARHDEICAWVSHLPQMLSTALAARGDCGDRWARAQGDDAAGGESVQHVAGHCAVEYRADCADAAGAGAAVGACAGEFADAGVEGRVSAGE
jgi:prephenate dehydrogenase